MREAARILASARKPFLLVGSGAFYARAWDALKAFAALTHIPILSQIWDRGCIEEAILQYVGVTRGGHVTNSALPKLAEADVVLTLGARIDYRVGSGKPPLFPRNARVIRVDIDPSEINRNVVPEVGIVGDPRTVLCQLADELRQIGAARHTDWLAEVRVARRALLDEWAARGYEDDWPLTSMRVLREIRKFLDLDITLLIDGGNIGQWAHMALFDRHPSHWLTCGASGVVGWGLSGAVAAKLARPRHPLLLLSGDGSAGFNLSEISTALRFRTPYVAVVVHCDGALGYRGGRSTGGPAHRQRVREIRFDRVAQALGARGVYVGILHRSAPPSPKGCGRTR